MKNTKEKILECALRLFNTQGISKVSLRTIANDMDISLGNLTYHFKKRDDIVESLYLELVAKMDAMTLQNVNDTNLLESFFKISDLIAESFYEYRFIMLDFVQITRNYPTIQSHYRELIKVREQQFQLLIAALIRVDLIREEIIKDEYVYLFKELKILSDFWLPALSIEQDIITKEDIVKHATLLKTKIFPYLTENGRTTFQKMNLTTKNHE
ncbi:TetR/AcrR family transcriptional regulator [uncultured Kordia sp.]|uniref:TetR/AcrR family transcriptional regulator n=1 Tax=uncultured Kordia sp. TaxID=507699 RepID=UPI002604D097|nr:TetR/AcrR family transcriptional regulator [uncultured Kordia sp.]